MATRDLSENTNPPKGDDAKSTGLKDAYLTIAPWPCAEPFQIPIL